MNFDLVYLRQVRQYCFDKSYLNSLPRELHILLGQYLLYDPDTSFRIDKTYNQDCIWSRLFFYNRIDRSGCEIWPVSNNDRSSIRMLLNKIMVNEPYSLVLSYADPRLLKLHYSDNNFTLVTSYVDRYVSYENRNERYKLSMIWLKALESLIY